MGKCSFLRKDHHRLHQCAVYVGICLPGVLFVRLCTCGKHDINDQHNGKFVLSFFRLLPFYFFTIFNNLKQKYLVKKQHTPEKEEPPHVKNLLGLGVLHVFWETPPRWYTLVKSNKRPPPHRNRSGRKSSTGRPATGGVLLLNCGSRRNV